MIIDSHCHLDFKELNSRLDEIIKDSHKVGIKYLLTICTNNESFNKINQIINKYINVYGTYGIHPHETKNYADLFFNRTMPKGGVGRKRDMGDLRSFLNWTVLEKKSLGVEWLPFTPNNMQS